MLSNLFHISAFLYAFTEPSGTITLQFLYITSSNAFSSYILGGVSLSICISEIEAQPLNDNGNIDIIVFEKCKVCKDVQFLKALL